MISPTAKHSIDQLFTRCARATFALTADDHCVVRPLDCAEAAGLGENHLVVLTISSLRFRLVTVFHIDDTHAARDYFLGPAQDRPFCEVFTEYSNLCVGGMNRELLPHFPQLGMSTPYVLDRRCAPYLCDLKPGHVSCFNITINHSITLHATLCLCEYAPLDFELAAPAPSEEATGVLELF